MFNWLPTLINSAPDRRLLSLRFQHLCLCNAQYYWIPNQNAMFKNSMLKNCNLQGFPRKRKTWGWIESESGLLQINGIPVKRIYILNRTRDPESLKASFIIPGGAAEQFWYLEIKFQQVSDVYCCRIGCNWDGESAGGGGPKPSSNRLQVLLSRFVDMQGDCWGEGGSCSLLLI